MPPESILAKKRCKLFRLWYNDFARAGVVEWQTRRTQNPMYASTCGFKSHLRHQVEAYMKIKKFPQSCLLVTTGKTKILVDPGGLKFDEEFLKDWETADAVLVTHKHGDHIKAEVLGNLGSTIYSTQEVQDAYPELEIYKVKAGDRVTVGNDAKVKVEVVKAVHGYNPRLGASKAEVFENVGYIIDDGSTRLYITSDTICFNNDFKADFVAAPVTGYGLTMTAFETALFTKETGAKKLVVIHLDNSIYSSDIAQVESILKQEGVDFVIPAIGDEIEL